MVYTIFIAIVVSSKEKGVTVITINSTSTDEVFLPPVLQDRKPRMHSGSQAASGFYKPEISFSSYNQGRSVKTSSSSNNSGDSSDKKLESSTKNISMEKSQIAVNHDFLNATGVNSDTITLRVHQDTPPSTNQHTATGEKNMFLIF